MTGQYIGDRFEPAPATGDASDKYSNDSVINPEPLADDEQEVGSGPYTDLPINEETEDTMPDSHVEENWDSQPVTDIKPSGEFPIMSTPVDATPTQEPVYSPAPERVTLLESEDSELFRARWKEIQGKFVDEPRTAVQLADALVTEVVDQITKMFASEHSALETQWKQGTDVSTEDLRKALQHYRSFFNRLVV